MFKGMSLSAKLYAGFAAVLLIAAALGAFAHTRLVKISGNARFITADCLPGVFLAEEIQKGAQQNLMLVSKHILATDRADMEAVEAESAKVKGNIDKLMDQYAATSTTDNDRQLFAKVPEARQKFVSLRNQIILPASRLGKKAEAAAAFKSQLEPAYEAY